MKSAMIIREFIIIYEERYDYAWIHNHLWRALWLFVNSYPFMKSAMIMREFIIIYEKRYDYS